MTCMNPIIYLVIYHVVCMVISYVVCDFVIIGAYCLSRIHVTFFTLV
jgi:hypothetical protein